METNVYISKTMVTVYPYVKTLDGEALESGIIVDTESSIVDKT